jgi:hypothetical protein
MPKESNSQVTDEGGDYV